jgi:nitric oxide dioxygenase
MLGCQRSPAGKAPGLGLATFCADSLPGDPACIHYDTRDLTSAEWHAAHTPATETLCYLCGPRPFPRYLVSKLLRHGIAAERTLYEFFGPADELLTPAAVEPAA